MRWNLTTIATVLGMAAWLGIAESQPPSTATRKDPAPAPSKVHALRLEGGTFHGPGALPDSATPPGILGHIEFRKPLTGETRFFNNGPEPPNVPGDQEIDNVTDGLLSDGRPFNEHVWGGIAEVGGGAMRLMTVVLGNGPNQGREIYRLDSAFHLNLTTDLAMDPGFPEGIVVRENLHITTGSLLVPLSLQTVKGAPGGQDRAGSLPSRVPVVGRLGDYDHDGFLDGLITGAENVPLGHMFTPGAPVVLERRFVSDIPASPLDAALLTVASVASHSAAWNAFVETRGLDTPLARHMTAHLDDYLREAEVSWQSAAALLDRAASEKSAAPVRAAREIVKAQIAVLARLREWSRAGVPAGPVPAQVSELARATFEAASRLATQLAPHTQYREAVGVGTGSPP